MKKDVSISKANRLINCGNLVLVSSFDGKKPNVLPIAWQMSVSHEPMVVAITIGKGNHSRDIITKSREFVINIPTVDILDAVVTCGKHSGKDTDKFKMTGLTPIPAQKVKAPLVSECIGHIEAKVIRMVHVGESTVFMGEVVAASAEEGLFSETWDMTNPRLKLIHHWGSLKFTITGPVVKIK